MPTKRTTRNHPPRNKKKESVSSMMKGGLDAARGIEKKSKRKPGMHSRSYAPKTLNDYETYMEKHFGVDGDDVVEDQSFFDQAIATSMYVKAKSKAYHPTRTIKRQHGGLDQAEGRAEDAYLPIEKSKTSNNRIAPSGSKPAGKKKKASGWAVEKAPKPTLKKDDDDDFVPDWLEGVFDNSDRHALGVGLMEKIFGGGASRSQAALRNKRPYFTYWVCIIQIIIFIVSMATYGIAPVGIGSSEVADEVLMTNLAIEQVSYLEKANLWIGPTQEALIHLGAKYSPCMRSDKNIVAVLEVDKQRENNTRCCVYNDGSGCVQSKSSDCSPTLATFMNWTENDMGYQNRISGPVCGQDPEYCTNPLSVEPEVWADDITDWPICTESNNVTTPTLDNRHMSCEVVGRPCCVGIQGECVIATEEYCTFRNGYFHKDATLCSQVDCMNEICGMFEFTESPDQWYRLYTSIFLHSGILSILLTLVLQFIIMRDLEKMICWWRMTIIYMGAGACGSLGSVIFLPYFVEAGPSGSTFGVLGAMSFEIFRWNVDEVGENPGPAIGKMFGFMVAFFLMGAVVAEIDNWAHLFGYFFGLCLAIAIRPIKKYQGHATSVGARVCTSIIALTIALSILVVLHILFYVAPLYSCDGCQYFNCIPFTDTYCEGMEVTIERSDEL